MEAHPCRADHLERCDLMAHKRKPQNRHRVSAGVRGLVGAQVPMMLDELKHFVTIVSLVIELLSLLKGVFGS